MTNKKPFILFFLMLLSLVLSLAARITFAATTVGSIAGEFAVAPSGAATYTIPIQVAPGIAGMEPSLSLAYGSQGGNGEVGVGWSLNGLSTIHRCPATRAQDGYKGSINYDRWDRFCLDGQRLMGPTAPTKIGPGQYKWDFRAEIWDQSEIIGYNISGVPNNNIDGSGPEWFRVRTKSGHILEFGKTQDSRIEAQGKTDVRVWALNKIADANGNYLKIFYNEDNANGEYFPIRIEYTGNDAVGVSPARSVEFQYTSANTRSDVSVGYLGGAKVSTSVLLTRILSKAGVDVVQDYTLTYTTSIGNKRSILKSIQQCGPSDCLPMTQFGWQEGGANAPNMSIQNAAHMYENAVSYRVDSDGDGSGDLLFWNSLKGELHIHPVKDGFVQPATDSKINFNVGMDLVLGDFTGRGKTEILFYGKTYQLSRIENGAIQPPIASGIFLSGLWTYWVDGNTPPKRFDTIQQAAEDICRLSVPGRSGRVVAITELDYTVTCSDNRGTFETGISVVQAVQLTTGDFDAWGGPRDGSTDLMVWDYIGKQVLIFAANEDGKLLAQYSSLAPYHGASAYVGDFNGDGITDLVFWSKEAGNLWIRINEGAQLQPESESRSGFHAGSDLITDDFNGDGITDLALWNSAKSELYVYPVAVGRLQAQSYSGSFGPQYAGALVSSADHTNDGVSDFIFWNNDSGNVWIHPVRNGIVQAVSFTAFNFRSTTQVCLPSLWPREPCRLPNMVKHSGLFPADFNGDGVLDLLFRSTRAGSVAVLMATNPYPDLIKNITDGLGSILNINYGPLTDSSVYTKETTATYPIVDIQYPLYVVNEYAAGNGLGGSYRIALHYAGAKLDLSGRGLLGFHWMETNDLQTNQRTRTTYRLDFPYIGQSDSISKYIGQSLIENEKYTWNHHVIASNVHLPFVSNVETNKYELDGVLITSSNVQTEMNTWGNVTNIIETTASGGSTYVKTVNNVYNQADQDKWHLGQLKRATVKSAVPQHWLNSVVAGPSMRVSAFEYYDDGRLKSEIIEPDSSANRLITTYEYDIFGNKVKTTVVGSDVAPRTTYTSYSLNHAYVPDSSINAEGHREEYRDYDLGTGKPRQIVDANQLVTYRSYDNFGRLTSETMPNGTVTTVTRKLCIAGGTCPAFSVYYETTSKSGSGSVTVYYDELRREVRKESQGFDGRVIYEDTEYDAQLRVKQKSRPYYAGSLRYWFRVDYDTLGRVSQQTAPDGGVTTYAYNALQTTSVADDGGKKQVSIRWDNAIGQLIRVQDANGKSNYYDYDPFGNLTFVKDALGNVSTMAYDLRGRKVAMNDPDMGRWEYRYFTTGELKWQKDAKGSITEMKYDRLGRMLERAAPEGVSKWRYDIAAGGVGRLAEIYGPNGTSEIHTYDSLGRSKSVRYNYGLIDQNSSYTLTTEYDQHSRVEYVTYPSTGFKVRNYYNSLGFLTGVANVTNPQAPVTLWTGNVYEANGQLSRETAGNAITTNRSYNPATGFVNTIVTGANGAIQNLAYQFDKLGNLEWRKDHNQSLTESFTYDQLNRLKTVALNGAATKAYEYDAIGNIIYKSDVGYYQYTSSRPHAVTQIAPTPRSAGAPVPGDANGDGAINALDQFAAIQHILGQGNAAGSPDCHQDNGVNVQDTMCINKKVVAAGNAGGNYLQYSYDANGNMTSGGGRTISYTSFNMPSVITQGGSETRFIYDADHQRIRQIGAAGSTSYVNAYYEKVVKGGVTEHHHYILGATGVVGVHITRSNDTSDTLYFHKDHLGSVETITDAAGTVKERFSFDAFGSRRMTNWQPAGSSSLGSTLTNRGYTGHEQLDNIGLVHMNARLYDPMLGRFLSPDPIVKYPQSTQGFNRYSYTDNNPLSRVDYSGYGWLSKTWKKFWNNGGREFTAIAAGIVLSYVNPVLAGFVSSYIYSRGDLRAAVMGALSAGAFYGVGTLTSTWSSGVAKVAAHGVTGGVMSELTGGSFKEGFLSAAFAKGFSGPIDRHARNYRSARVFAAAVVGGTASRLGGGSFANGAMTGAFSRLFNAELHREIEEVQKNARPAKRYVGDGQFKYQSILDVSLPELSEASKLLRRFAFIVDAAGITVERGERYYQYGTEYDVVGEERLIGRDDKGYIIYRSDIPTNNYPTGKIDFEPGEPNNFIRETDTRVCIGEGTICLF